MNWLNPVAFAGLALVAVPILVHLFARRNARELRFPTLRFIDDARAVAPRRTRLTDVPLLLLRVAIIALAVAALARPWWMNDARRAEMQRRVARVVIVDTSASVARQTASGESGVVVARREGARLAAEGVPGLMVETDRLHAELGGAVDWLGASGSANREIVLVSDFQRGAITEADVAAIPADIGVRVLRVDVSGVVMPGNDPAPLVSVVAAPGDQQVAAATVEVAARRSVVDSTRRIVVDFTGAVPDAVLDQPWMGDVAWALRNGAVRLGARDGALVLAPSVAPGTLDAALIVKRAVDAATRHVVGERDSVMVAGGEVSAWERDAVGESSRVASAGSDGRWLWLAVLLLLIVEHFARTGVAERRADTRVAER